MAYIYRHIRLDKNEPFYIGIGSDKDYKRAYNKHIESLIESSINKRIKIFCPELNILFNSLTEASKIINKSTGNISNILRSKNNKTREGLTLIKY